MKKRRRPVPDRVVGELYGDMTRYCQNKNASRRFYFGGDGGS